MAEIKQGRWTAEIEGDFVVFLIGARINKPWQVVRIFRDLGIVVPGPVANIFEANISHLSSRSLFFLGIVGVVWPASASMSFGSAQREASAKREPCPSDNTPSQGRRSRTTISPRRKRSS